VNALIRVKSEEKKSELNRLIDDWIYSNLHEEVRLLDAIQTMKSADLNAAISQVAKMSSNKIIGNGGTEPKASNTMPTT